MEKTGAHVLMAAFVVVLAAAAERGARTRQQRARRPVRSECARRRPRCARVLRRCVSTWLRCASCSCSSRRLAPRPSPSCVRAPAICSAGSAWCAVGERVAAAERQCGDRVDALCRRIGAELTRVFDDDDDDVWRNDALSRAVHTATLVPSRADVWTSDDGVATIDTLLGTVERHGAACVELVPPEIASDPTFRDAFADIDAAAASMPCTPLATSSSATSAVRFEREGVEFVVERHTALDLSLIHI